MKPFTEEDLISYHMHELSPRRARALELALQNDPALAAEFDAFAAMLQDFEREETPVISDEATERVWLAVRPSLPVHQAPTAMRFRWQVPALAGSGIAFAGTLAFVALHHEKPPLRHAQGELAAVRQPRTGGPQPPSSLDAPQAEVEGELKPHESERQQKERRRFIGDAPQAFRHAAGSRISYLSLARTPAETLDFIPLAKLPLPVLHTRTQEPELTVQEGAAPTDGSHKVGSNTGEASSRRHTPTHYKHETDLTFAMGGTLIGTRQGNNSGSLENFQGASRAVSAVAAFHQQLRPAAGYRLTFSYARPEFAFTTRNAASSLGTSYINSRIFEIAGTYVVHGPRLGRVNTFAEAGAGLMELVPTVASADTHSNMRGAAVFGAGAEVALSRRIALHGSYRGQIFRGPDFHADGPAGPYVTSRLFSSEPTVGITFQFIRK